MSVKLDATAPDRLNSITMNQDALTSLNHFQETGLRVTGDEVNDWIESWGTKDELPPPKCHA